MIKRETLRLRILVCALWLVGMFLGGIRPATSAEAVRTQLDVACKGYLCDYLAICRSEYFDPDQAPEACSAQGKGWHVATPSTTAAATTLTTLAKAARTAAGLPGYGAVIAGKDVGQNRKFVYTAGRFEGMIFSQGSSPQNGFYASWASGQPDNSGPSGTREDCVILMDSYSDASCFRQYRADPCLGCERPHCDKILDCTNANTEAVQGYWPRCTCRCKPGFAGPKCARAATATLALTTTLALTATLALAQTITSAQTLTTALTITPAYLHTPSVAGTRTPTPTNNFKTLSLNLQTRTVSNTILNTLSWTIVASRSQEDTLSTSRSYTSTFSLSVSKPLSASFAPPLSFTVPSTLSSTINPSSSITDLRSLTGSKVMSLSTTSTNSLTASLTLVASSSETFIHTDSSTHSVSPRPTASPAASHSLTLRATRSETVSGSCRSDIPPEVSNATCSLVWLAGKGGGGCERIDLPFSFWGGKSGGTFELLFAVNNTYVTLQETVALPEMTGPFEALSATPNLRNNTISVTVRYTGPDTMNFPGALTVRIPRTVFSCPQPAPLLFTVILIAAPKSPIAGASETIQQIATTISLVMAMPAVAAQMGMLSGLQDLTRCEAADLTEELDFMNNPTRLSFGERWGSSQRGVFAGTVAITFAFTVFLLFLAGVKHLAITYIGVSPSTYRQQLQSLGAPGVYLLVAAFLMDSTVTAGVAMVLFGVGVMDRVLGALFALGGYAYVASLFWVTIRAEVRSSKPASNHDDNIIKVNSPKKTKSARTRRFNCLYRWFTPSVELVGDAAFQARYGEYLADLRRVRYYRGLELLAVCIVSSLQAAAYGTRLSCVIELCIAQVALVILFSVVVFTRPMSVRFEFMCTVISLGCQVVTAALMITNAFLQELTIEVAALGFIMLGTLVTLAQAIEAFIVLCIENRIRIRDLLVEWHRRLAGKGMPKKERPELLTDVPSNHLAFTMLPLDEEDIPLSAASSSSLSMDLLQEPLDDRSVRQYTKGNLLTIDQEIEAVLTTVETTVMERHASGIYFMDDTFGNEASFGGGDEELLELVDLAAANDATRRASAFEQAQQYKKRERKRGISLADIKIGPDNFPLGIHSNAAANNSTPFDLDQLILHHEKSASQRSASMLKETSGAFDEDGPDTIPTFV